MMTRMALIVVVAIIAILCVHWVIRGGLVVTTLAPAAQTAAVIDAIATSSPSTDFNQTGTLTFYPNNVGPVPYLFYQNENGATVSKALVFPHSAPINFSSWSGARVSVTGYVDREHVVVSTITYISAP